MVFNFNLLGCACPRWAAWGVLAALWHSCGCPVEATEAAAEDAAIQALVRRLESESFEERNEADEALSRLGARALPALEAAARDGSAEGQMRARGLIARIALDARLSERMKAVFPGLVDRLCGADPNEWRAVLEAALEKPELKFADWSVLLVKALQAGKRDMFDSPYALAFPINERAGEEIGDLDNPELSSGIAGLLQHDDPHVRSSAAAAIGGLGMKSAIPQLIKVLGDREAAVRVEAAYSLGKLRAQEARPFLIKLLKDGSSWVRWNAVCSLGRMNAKEAAPHILELLTDTDKQVRRHAAEILGNMEAQMAVPRLTLCLKDQEVSVRVTAAAALCKLGVRKAIPELMEIFAAGKDLSDGDSLFLLSQQALTEAALVLKSIGAREAIPQLVAALKNGNEHVRREAAAVLGELGSQEAIASLIERLLKDKDSMVRHYAAHALGNLGAKEAIPHLIAALDDEDTHLRWTAVYVLSVLGAKQIVPRLMEFLDRQDMRIAAANALGILGTKEALGRIAALLEDESLSDTDRVCVTAALIRLEDRKRVPALISFLKSDQADVFIEAAQECAALKLSEAREILESRLEVRPETAAWAAKRALESLQPR